MHAATILSLIVWLISVSVPLQFTSGLQTNADVCLRHADNNFAYGFVDEVVCLGHHYGVLVLSGREMFCLDTIDVHNLPTKGSDICNRLIDWISNANILREGSIRFNMAIGHKFYWTIEDNDEIKIMDLPGDMGIVNPRFNAPNVIQWMNRYLKDYRISSTGLISLGQQSPQYPSALLTIEDPYKIRQLYFLETSQSNYLDSKLKYITDIKLNISAIFVGHNVYQPVMKFVALFDKYYAEIVVDFENNKIGKPYPVVPMQQLFGCPTNLCWWPLIDDVIYHDGVYYIFHGYWLWKFVEGQPYSPDISLSIHLTDLDFQIQSAYYDEHFNACMLIYFKEKRFMLAEFDPDSNTVTKKQTKIGIGDSINQLIAGTYIDGKLCILVALQTDIYIMKFEYNQGQDIYMWHTRDKTQFKSISAMFMNRVNGYLYVISGFFVYIYESVHLGNSFEESRCTVTYVSMYFNCTVDYYKKMELYNNFHTYAGDAEKYHKGPLLPDRAVLVRSWPKDGQIRFYDKTDEKPEGSGKPFDKLTLGLLIGVSVVAVVLMVLIFYCTVCHKRKRKGLTIRHNQNFNKFMPELKERWRELMQKDRNSSSKTGTNSDFSRSKTSDSRKTIVKQSKTTSTGRSVSSTTQFRSKQPPQPHKTKSHNNHHKNRNNLGSKQPKHGPSRTPPPPPPMPPVFSKQTKKLSFLSSDSPFN